MLENLKKARWRVAVEGGASAVARLTHVARARAWAWRWEALGLSAVIVVAVLVRVVKLGEIPANITADEADLLQNVYHILEGTGPGFFDFDWKVAPAFSAYLMAGVVKLFGFSITDFRLYPVLLSVGTIGLFYLLARQSLSVVASLLAAALLGSNLWFLHFSRTAWDNVSAALFATGAAWALSLAIQRKEWRWWVLTGVFTSLGLYGYFSGRVIFLAVIASVAIALVFRWRDWRRSVAGLLLAGLLAATLFAPQMINILNNWDHANSPMEVHSVFEVEGEYLGDHETGAIVWSQVQRNVGGWLLMQGDEMGRGLWGRYTPPGRPPLDKASAILFWSGALLSVFAFRRAYIWWPFLIVPLFLVQVFSVGTPDLARGVVVAPFYFLFIGLSFDRALQALRGRVPRLLGVVALLLVVVFVAFTNVRDYFNWIGTSDALTLRGPAIERCEFDAWRELGREAAREGSRNLDPARWEATRDVLNCS